MELLSLKARLNTVPLTPGVYIFKDTKGEILYVGKASKLRNRLRSYFNSRRGLTTKTRQLVSLIADFELMLTDSELEALILECNLIKQHRPKYNIKLRDDKHYPYLRVSVDEEWPRVYVTRKFERDGARYFGPFTNSKSVWQSLYTLKRLFPYRSCRKAITGDDARPCLDYHINRCIGPCIGACKREEYMGIINQVTLFLEGKSDQLLRDMRARMEQASERLEFERAAAYRDKLHALEDITQRQKVISTAMEDEDVIAYARTDGEACVQVFFIRGGKLLGREHFVLDGTQDEDPKQVMTNFVVQFYDRAAQIPERVILQHEVDQIGVVQSWLTSKRGSKVVVRVPRKGEKKQLVEMVAQNASQTLEQMRAKWLADDNKTGAATAELAEYLALEGPPERIECYDISNIQGTSAVGSMVVFEKGKPKTSDYRRFQIKTVKGANDYAMLEEVFRRRFKRAAGDGGKDAKNWTKLPDLVIVDGGKGQLGVAVNVLQQSGFAQIPVVGLAKENEAIFVPGDPEPLMLPRTSPALYLVQRIRDEAHRFAITYHRNLRSKRAYISPLSDIPGIGPKRKAALIKSFGSLKALREATIEDIAAAPMMTKRLAETIKKHL